MRLYITLLLLLLSVTQVSADGILNFPEITSNGYYAAPTVRWTTINTESTVLAGGRAGWVMNHMYTVGLAGCMSVIDVGASSYANEYYNRSLDARFGYGGIDIEYIDKFDHPFHYTMGVLAGLGRISYIDPEDDDFDRKDSVIVFEPKAQAIYNLTSWCRLGLGLSYRYINGLEMVGMTKYDLGGVSFSGTVKFGSF